MYDYRSEAGRFEQEEDDRADRRFRSWTRRRLVNSEAAADEASDDDCELCYARRAS